MQDNNDGFIKMKNLPITDRPYEKLELYGEQSLSDTELLAILIKTGTKNSSAKMVAEKIMTLDTNNEGISFLCNIPLEDLTETSGIGRVKALLIKSAIELGRRASRKNINTGRTVIKSPLDVAEYLLEEMQHLQNEELRIILLDARNIVTRCVKGNKGSVREMFFSPRDIFKDAIRYNAASVILVHNHPSGNPQPSTADIDTTRDLMKLGIKLGIQLIDHVVLAKEGYFSIKSLLGTET